MDIELNALKVIDSVSYLSTSVQPRSSEGRNPCLQKRFISIQTMSTLELSVVCTQLLRCCVVNLV